MVDVVEDDVDVDVVVVAVDVVDVVGVVVVDVDVDVEVNAGTVRYVSLIDKSLSPTFIVSPAVNDIQTDSSGGPNFTVRKTVEMKRLLHIII